MAKQNPQPTCVCGRPECPANIVDRLSARPPNAAWPLGPQLPQQNLLADYMFFTTPDGRYIV